VKPPGIRVTLTLAEARLLLAARQRAAVIEPHPDDGEDMNQIQAEETKEAEEMLWSAIGIAYGCPYGTCNQYSGWEVSAYWETEEGIATTPAIRIIERELDRRGRP